MDCDLTTVAHLRFRYTQQPDRTRTWLIDSNDEFDIGRKEIQKAWDIYEPTISTHHLRFRCVVYEDDGEQQVAPMIYARVLSSNPVRLARAGVEGNDEGLFVSKADPDTLLNHGDVLQLTPEMSIEFQAEEDCASESNERDPTQAAELQRFSDQFLVSDRRLGVGGNASVFVAVKQHNKRQVACKVVALPFTQSAAVQRIKNDLRLTPQQRAAESKAIQPHLMKRRESLAREYNVLKVLNHPNIITLEKVICATYNIYIFQELITGGDLLSYIDQKGALNEAQAAVIIRQILKAVEYLHDNGVVHRDIKPENILMTSWRDGARVVLTDFGQARTTDDAKANSSTVFRMRTVVGTYGYTAPEVLKHMKRDLQQQGYSKSIDIWSIGCITATLLTNDMMFPDETAEYAANPPTPGAQDTPQRWNLSIMDTGRAWFSIGRKAKSFIKGCLVLDENKRLTAKESLLHAWFTNKYYAADIDAAYQRAIQDWIPRKKSGNLIEFIDTTDVVPVVSRPGYPEHPAEEVKSHHFQATPVAVPMGSFLLNMPACGPHQKHVRTPLPAIYEEAGRDIVNVQGYPVFTQDNSVLAGPIRVRDSTQLLTQGTDGVVAEDFAAPESHSIIDPELLETQDGTKDSVTQSQVMLDELSPSHLPLVGDDDVHSRKRMWL